MSVKKGVFTAGNYILFFNHFLQCFVFQLAGSESTSGNVDPDPGSKKKIVINSTKNQPKL